MDFKKSTTKDKLLMLIPIFGWLFIFYGLIYPIDNLYVKLAWYIDIFLSVGVHALQLFASWPLGKKAGYTPNETFLMTMIFGATWWKPLKDRLEHQK